MNKEAIKFAEWLAENHYRLHNIQEGMHIWQNEEGYATTDYLFFIYKDYVKSLN